MLSIPLTGAGLGVPGPGQTPADLSGYIDWWDANDFASFTITSSPDIDTWTGQNSNDLTGAAGDKPHYEASVTGFNNNPGVFFDGVDNHFTSVVGATDSGTIHTIISLNAVSVTNRIYGAQTSMEGIDAVIRASDNALNGTVGTTASGAGSETAGSIDTPYVVTLRWSGGTAERWLNGVPDASWAYVGTPSNGGNYYVGNRQFDGSPSAGASLDGHIAQFLMYNVALSDADLNFLGTYNNWDSFYGYTWTTI